VEGSVTGRKEEYGVRAAVGVAVLPAVHPDHPAVFVETAAATGAGVYPSVLGPDPARRTERHVVHETAQAAVAPAAVAVRDVPRAGSGAAGVFEGPPRRTADGALP